MQKLKWLVVFLIFVVLYCLAVIETQYDEKEAKTTKYKFPKQYNVKYDEHDNGVEFNVFHQDGTKERIVVQFDLMESDISKGKASLYLGHRDMSEGEASSFATFTYLVYLSTLEGKRLAYPKEIQE